VRRQDRDLEVLELAARRRLDALGTFRQCRERALAQEHELDDAARIVHVDASVAIRIRCGAADEEAVIIGDPLEDGDCIQDVDATVLVRIARA
jgi:hypothetical protein